MTERERKKETVGTEMRPSPLSISKAKFLKLILRNGSRTRTYFDYKSRVEHAFSAVCGPIWRQFGGLINKTWVKSPSVKKRGDDYFGGQNQATMKRPNLNLIVVVVYRYLHFICQDF